MYYQRLALSYEGKNVLGFEESYRKITTTCIIVSVEAISILTPDITLQAPLVTPVNAKVWIDSSFDKKKNRRIDRI